MLPEGKRRLELGVRGEIAAADAALAELVAGIGGVVTVGELEHETPARARWELHGAHGTLRCGILMTPAARPRIQKLDVAVVD
jgi:hypothetical protein